MTDILTGSTSVYPYGVDSFEFQHNFEKAELGHEGDLIKAGHHNRLADAIIQVEKDLLNCAQSYVGDMRVACITTIIPSLIIDGSYLISVPQEMMDFLCPDGNYLRGYATCQLGLRPTTKLDIWSAQVDSRGAMLVSSFLGIDSVCFAMHEPDGIYLPGLNSAPPISGTTSYKNGMNAGDFIASLILFRQV